ncbi:hypothetical protein EGI22_01380 [Lacihabitans sp. LS3-19]|nr:hypothetical protein [Lacihabitans sp. LS3-19]
MNINKALVNTSIPTSSLLSIKNLKSNIMARIIVPKHLVESNHEITSLLKNHFPNLSSENSRSFSHNFYDTNKDDNQTLTPILRRVKGTLSIMGFARY